MEGRRKRRKEGGRGISGFISLPLPRSLSFFLFSLPSISPSPSLQISGTLKFLSGLPTLFLKKIIKRDGVKQEGTKEAKL